MSKKGVQPTKWSTNNLQNKSKYLEIIILYVLCDTDLASVFPTSYSGPTACQTLHTEMSHEIGVKQ